MSILVKNAHLPANCDECMNLGGEDGFQLNLAISRYGAKCPLIEGFVSADDIQSGSERHKDCPLSEATERGLRRKNTVKREKQ